MKPQIVRISRLEKILNRIEGMAELMNGEKAEGAKLVIQMLRKELNIEEEDEKRNN